jgi:hypothetical protein
VGATGSPKAPLLSRNFDCGQGTEEKNSTHYLDSLLVSTWAPFSESNPIIIDSHTAVFPIVLGLLQHKCNKLSKPKLEKARNIMNPRVSSPHAIRPPHMV